MTVPERTGAALGPQLFLGARPDPSRFVPPRMTHERAPGKPHGGFWTSSLILDGRNGVGSAWLDWCEREAFGDPAAPRWRLDPAPAAVLLAIDGVADLAAILARFPHDDGMGLGHVFAAIDFPAVAAAGYAGVHLSAAGQEATRWAEPGLATWDCESTCWLRWAFVGEPVRLDGAGGKEGPVSALGD